MRVARFRSVKLSILCAALALGGCWDEAGDDDDDDITPPPINPDALPTPQTTMWQATITGVVGFTNLSGEAFVTWTETHPFSASITLRGDTPGELRVWHVHFGVCIAPGDIVGVPGAYEPLAIDSAGVATTNARVDFELDVAAPYHVDVHFSPADLETIIACGDLIRQ